MAPSNDASSTTQSVGPEGNQTALTLRVRYTECDPMGMAHHSVFPVWMEMARTEHLRQHGVAYSVLEKQGIWFVVAKLAVRYRRPAYYDELVTVRVWEAPEPHQPGQIKVDHEYEFTRGVEVLAHASSTLVCVDPKGKPQPIPDGVIG